MVVESGSCQVRAKITEVLSIIKNLIKKVGNATLMPTCLYSYHIIYVYIIQNVYFPPGSGS